MNKRDSQLYPNATNVWALVDFLRVPKALQRLSAEDFVTSPLTAKRLLSRLTNPWQNEPTIRPADSECANQLTAWAQAQLTRAGWQILKRAFVKQQSAGKRQSCRIDVSQTTREDLLTLKSTLGFTHYSEVIDYLLQYRAEVECDQADECDS
jgi:hypothetical protein